MITRPPVEHHARRAIDALANKLRIGVEKDPAINRQLCLGGQQSSRISRLTSPFCRKGYPWRMACPAGAMLSVTESFGPRVPPKPSDTLSQPDVPGVEARRTPPRLLRRQANVPPYVVGQIADRTGPPAPLPGNVDQSASRCPYAKLLAQVINCRHRILCNYRLFFMHSFSVPVQRCSQVLSMENKGVRRARKRSYASRRSITSILLKMAQDAGDPERKTVQAVIRDPEARSTAGTNVDPPAGRMNAK